MKVNAKDESTADDRVMESANEKLESFIVRWFSVRKAGRLKKKQVQGWSNRY